MTKNNDKTTAPKRHTEIYNANYEEVVQWVDKEIPEYMYNVDYEYFMHYLVENYNMSRHFDTSEEPSFAEVAFVKYLEINKKEEEENKVFRTELYETALQEYLERNDLVNDYYGIELYEVVVTFHDDVTTEVTRARLGKYVNSDEIVDARDNVATFHVEVDDENYLLEDLEVLLYYILDDYKLGYYSLNKIIQDK